MNTNEVQTFKQNYRELDPTSMALLRTIIELTVILFKQQTEPRNGGTS